MWDYAEHSHTVKLHGGPKKYDRYIKNQTNMKWFGVVTILAPLAVKGAASIVQDIKKNRKSKDYIVLEETVLDDEQDN